jgi:hypothetical protein
MRSMLAGGLTCVALREMRASGSTAFTSGSPSRRVTTAEVSEAL